MMMRGYKEEGKVDEGYAASELRVVCAKGNFEDAKRVIAELLEAGVSLDGADEKGRTALHRACGCFGDAKFASFSEDEDLDRARIVALLLVHGAQPTSGNRWGDTPLHTAARFGRIGASAALLAYCGDDPAECATSGRIKYQAWTLAEVSGHCGLASLICNWAKERGGIVESERRRRDTLLFQDSSVDSGETLCRGENQAVRIATWLSRLRPGAIAVELDRGAIQEAVVTLLLLCLPGSVPPLRSKPSSSSDLNAPTWERI